jgi:hypothetical protein
VYWWNEPYPRPLHEMVQWRVHHGPHGYSSSLAGAGPHGALAHGMAHSLPGMFPGGMMAPPGYPPHVKKAATAGLGSKHQTILHQIMMMQDKQMELLKTLAAEWPHDIHDWKDPGWKDNGWKENEWKEHEWKEQSWKENGWNKD